MSTMLQSNISAEELFARQFEQSEPGPGVRALERKVKLTLQEQLLANRAKAGRVKELLDEFMASADKTIRARHKQAQSIYDQAEQEMAAIEEDIWKHEQILPRDVAWMEKNEALIRRRGFAAQALIAAQEGLIFADEEMRGAVHRAIAARIAGIDSDQKALHVKFIEERKVIGKDRQHLQMLSQQLTRNLFNRSE